jgi:hypothetical protein
VGNQFTEGSFYALNLTDLNESNSFVKQVPPCLPFHSRSMHIQVLLVLSLIFHASNLSGQSRIDLSDTGRGQEIIQGIFDRYFPDHHIRKIRGRAYFNPYLSAPEHQFFMSKSSLEGILYTGDDTICCPDVFYDLYRDQLLVYVPALYSLVEMDKIFIERFTLYGEAGGQMFEFVKLEPGGYHQKIYEGADYSLYKKYSKYYKQRAKQGRYYDGFDQYEQLIFRREHANFHVRNNRDLLALFPGDRPALMRYLRRSRINLRGVTDEDARVLMQYLEEKYPPQNMQKSEDRWPGE